MRFARSSFAFVLTLALAAQCALAVDATVTFPLGEHYRAGKYLPARVVAKTNDTVRVDAPGALPVHIASASGNVDAVVPLLAIGTIDRKGGPSRALFDDERLVGTTTQDIDAAEDLFPGRRITVAAIGLSSPLPGPAMAWGALDAVCLDAPAAARVSQRQAAALLAAGTAIAVRSETRPGDRWPWERHGAWWVVRPDAPALGTVIQPHRYTPAADRGTPARLRRTLMFVLVAFAVAAAAASLWRWRHAWLVIVLLAAATGVGLAAWHARQPKSVASSTDERSGVWLDRWTRYSAFADGEVRHPVAASDSAVWPIFFSRRHAQEADIRLECAADGTPQAFAGTLKRGQSILFLTRSVADH